MSTRERLDLHDIQGNIAKAYSRFGMPKARYVFFSVRDERAGRDFIGDLLDEKLITTSAPWVLGLASGEATSVPEVAVNVAFTFDGLRHLGLPQASLQSFPEEFAMGMRARRAILGDDGPSDPDHWDKIWRSEPVDVFVAISGRDTPVIERCYEKVIALANRSNGGVELRSGHAGNASYQDASAIFAGAEPTPKEHFGYTDGISNPYFIGAETDPSNVIGGGKRKRGDINSVDGWAPIETGEFLLGHRDEAFELPAAPIPAPLSHNGSFLVYRKLHQNVASFDAYLEATGKSFPGGKELLAAKFAGRWRNGAPLATCPTEADANKLGEEWDTARKAVAQAPTPAKRDKAKAEFAQVNIRLVAFDYSGDRDGAHCPFGAHARRVHPRVALEFDKPGAFDAPDGLANRRRLLRRGLPYGDSSKERNDAGEQGIIFMSLGASIQRQFEFVLQQWANYGNDFRIGNDKDPLIGNHEVSASGGGRGRMLIESDSPSRPPFFSSGIPRFVTTRGGDYFFVPSVTALRLIARGLVDPT